MEAIRAIVKYFGNVLWFALLGFLALFPFWGTMRMDLALHGPEILLLGIPYCAVIGAFIHGAVKKNEEG